MKITKVATLLLCMMTYSSVRAAESDFITTVADKGTSGVYYAVLCPEADVAISKDDAEVFSIYMDMGKAYFNVLRIRSGMNVIKAGDHVIVKTTEPKTIPLLQSDKRSSVSYDDIICPDEDTSVEDFCANHPVDEGEYIYMLTNMERNGGFGFTHFTGDVMRKGCFFIVSTIEPETTEIKAATRERRDGDLSASKVVYDQKGQRVVSPRAGQIYIQGGRKYLKAPIGGSEHINVQRQNTRAAEDIEDGDRVPFLPGEAGNDDGFVTTTKSLDRGDANGDGEVNTNDVEAISDYIMEMPLETFVKKTADVNADDVINVADIVGTVNIIMAKKE